MAVVIYRSQQRSRRGQGIDANQSQEVTSCLPNVAYSFILAREFDGSVPLAFSPQCRVQSKPKVACFCIVMFYLRIEILAVLVPVI